MNEWLTSIQPPGLMKMRLMHHLQEHDLGHQGTSKQSLTKCATPTVLRCHMNSLCGLHLSSRQG